MRADGKGKATILVFAADKFNNPIPGVSVTIESSNNNDEIILDSDRDQTNENGITWGFITATVEGTRKITAIVDNLVLEPAYITFQKEDRAVTPTVAVTETDLDKNIKITPTPILQADIGKSLVVQAKIESAAPLEKVILRYRSYKTTVWNETAMVLENGLYKGIIPAKNITKDGLAYQIYALATDGNQLKTVISRPKLGGRVSINEPPIVTVSSTKSVVDLMLPVGWWMIRADDYGTVIVMVTLFDEAGRPVKNKTVNLVLNDANNTIISAKPTDSHGEAWAKFRTTSDGLKKVKILVDNKDIADQPMINILPADTPVRPIQPVRYSNEDESIIVTHQPVVAAKFGQQINLTAKVEASAGIKNVYLQFRPERVKTWPRIWKSYSLKEQNGYFKGFINKQYANKKYIQYRFVVVDKNGQRYETPIYRPKLYK